MNTHIYVVICKATYLSCKKHVTCAISGLIQNLPSDGMSKGTIEGDTVQLRPYDGASPHPKKPYKVYW